MGGGSRKGDGGLAAGAGLEEIVKQASRALASLDAARLEELAFSCAALVHEERDALGPDGASPSGIEFQLRSLGRMLDYTKTNLNVLHRARSRRTEYGPASGRE